MLLFHTAGVHEGARGSVINEDNCRTSVVHLGAFQSQLVASSLICVYSKKVSKLNFRQYGQMEKHSQEETKTWRESEGRRSEREKIGKGESPKREDAGARKGRKAAEHCVFLMFCGPRVSKSRLAKAAGAVPAGQRQD